MMKIHAKPPRPKPPQPGTEPPSEPPTTDRASPCRPAAGRCAAARAAAAAGAAAQTVYRCGPTAASIRRRRAPTARRSTRPTRARAEQREGGRRGRAARRRSWPSKLARERRAAEAAPQGQHGAPASTPRTAPPSGARRQRSKPKRARSRGRRRQRRRCAAPQAQPSAPSQRSRPSTAALAALRQAPVLGPQRAPRLSTCAGFDRNAGHRADLHALRLVEVADALGALARVDLVDLGAHRDRLVRALGLADIAVDALVGDHQRHGGHLSRVRARALTRSCRRSSTEGATNLETSPPKRGNLAHEGAADELVLVATASGTGSRPRASAGGSCRPSGTRTRSRSPRAGRAPPPCRRCRRRSRAAGRERPSPRRSGTARRARVAMSSRSAIVNMVRLWWPAATARISRSNRRLARRIRSSWPSVIGSKVPG